MTNSPDQSNLYSMRETGLPVLNRISMFHGENTTIDVSHEASKLFSREIMTSGIVMYYRYCPGNLP